MSVWSIYFVFVFVCGQTLIQVYFCVKRVFVLILSVICTAFLQCHRSCVCEFGTLLSCLHNYTFLVYYITKVFLFSILLICTTKIDTTNRISKAIINEANGFKQRRTNNKQFHRIESFSSLPNRPALIRTTKLFYQIQNE